MSDGTKEFMLEEYKQIANAYQDLHSQHNELVKTYLTLVALPSTIFAIAIQMLKQFSIDDISILFERINNINDQELILHVKQIIGQAYIFNNIVHIGSIILIALLFILTLVGFSIFSAYTATRAEAILYVKTVNCVRRYFVESEKNFDLSKYLALPIIDSIPPFSEKYFTRSFWNLSIFIILNSLIFFVFLLSLISTINDNWINNCKYVIISLFIIIFIVLHLLWNKKLKKQNENIYKIKFNSNFPFENKEIGIDLDGTIADLMESIIKYSYDKYGIKIKSNDIKTHDLLECTELNTDQIKIMFSDPLIFSTLNEIEDSVKNIKMLSQLGFKIHIVTDRFWDKSNWKTSKDWLDEKNITYDILSLVPGSNKIDYAKKCNILFFVEDNLETAISLSNYCKKVYLYDTSYNKGELPENVIRFKKWGDLIKMIKKEITISI